MSDNEFGFEGVFEHLSPEDFVRETSASGDFTNVPPNVGAEAWSHFVIRFVEQAYIGLLAADGTPCPVAILSNANDRRLFHAYDDESYSDFTERLAREAASMEATWFATFKLTQGAHEDIGTRNASTPVDEIEEGEKLRPIIYLYAERREGQDMQFAQGMLDFNELKLNQVFWAPAAQPAPQLLSQVLGGVTAGH